MTEHHERRGFDELCTDDAICKAKAKEREARSVADNLSMAHRIGATPEDISAMAKDDAAAAKRYHSITARIWRDNTDDARFREACDHLIGEGTDCPTLDRLDRIEQQVQARVMATWPGGIGEIPEG